MMFRLVCPWSSKDGNVIIATNYGLAAQKFASEVYGKDWGNAKIVEEKTGKSALVLCSGKRPFKLALA